MRRGLSSEGKRIRGKAGQIARQRRLARTNGLCERCLDEGHVTFADEVDHIIPLSRGGEDVDGNTRNLCLPHHDEAWREQFGTSRIRLAEIGVDGWPLAPDTRFTPPQGEGRSLADRTR